MITCAMSWLYAAGGKVSVVVWVCDACGTASLTACMGGLGLADGSGRAEPNQKREYGVFRWANVKY